MNTMEIKVLGPGCPKCKDLNQMISKLVEANNIDASITKIEDILEIMSYGVMSTPALVINGKVVVKGRVPSQDELLKILTSNE